MKKYILGLVLVIFLAGTIAPAFAKPCGPNSRVCQLHHEHCKCGGGQAKGKS
jgi:hypothetical protein